MSVSSSEFYCGGPLGGAATSETPRNGWKWRSKSLDLGWLI
jgi:hypothetical protein